jgi:hypothetical protein
MHDADCPPPSLVVSESWWHHVRIHHYKVVATVLANRAPPCHCPRSSPPPPQDTETRGGALEHERTQSARRPHVLAPCLPLDTNSRKEEEVKAVGLLMIDIGSLKRGTAARVKRRVCAERRGDAI